MFHVMNFAPASLRTLAGAAILAAGLMAATVPAGAVDIQEVTSPGGITAWLVEENTLPIIAITFAFAGGGTQDPEGKEGLSNLLTAMLDEGAGDIPSQQFQGLLDDLSIDLSFDSGLDEFYGTLRTLTVNRDEAFLLLRLAITEPRFDEEPIDRMKAALSANLRYELTQPNNIAGRALMEAAFPDHPYSRPTDGTLETLAGLTADDLRGYREKVFARDNLTVSVVGDIDAATLAVALDEIFGGLAETAQLVVVAEAPAVAGARIDIPMNLPQTVLSFAGSGVKRDDPDFIPVYLADHILGGGSFSSRLFQEVRDKRGLAYGVSTGLVALNHAGRDFGGTATRSDRADEALAVIEDVMRKYGVEGPTDEEVETAKRYLIGNYALRFTSSTRIARQLLGIQLDNLGIDYINRRNGLINGTTPDQVREAARRIFSGDLIVVRVGRVGEAATPAPTPPAN